MSEALSATVELVNPLGLHARAAAKLVDLANRFESHIEVSKGDQTADAKSIMGVMMLAAGMGSEIEIETAGVDEEEAMAAVRALIDDKFGEGQ